MVGHSRTGLMKHPIVAGEHAVSGLPFANGLTFATLDAYIAYLEKYAAPIDRSWYRQIRPDIYRLETGNMREKPSSQIFTRKELEMKFGFKR